MERRPCSSDFVTTTNRAVRIALAALVLILPRPAAAQNGAAAAEPCPAGIDALQSSVRNLQASPAANNSDIASRLAEISASLGQLRQYMPSARQLVQQARQLVESIESRTCDRDGSRCVNNEPLKQEMRTTLNGASRALDEIEAEVRKEQAAAAQQQVQARMADQQERMLAEMRAMQEERDWQRAQQEIQRRCSRLIDASGSPPTQPDLPTLVPTKHPAPTPQEVLGASQRADADRPSSSIDADRTAMRSRIDHLTQLRDKLQGVFDKLSRDAGNLQSYRRDEEALRRELIGRAVGDLIEQISLDEALKNGGFSGRALERIDQLWPALQATVHAWNLETNSDAPDEDAAHQAVDLAIRTQAELINLAKVAPVGGREMAALNMAQALVAGVSHAGITATTQGSTRETAVAVLNAAAGVASESGNLWVKGTGLAWEAGQGIGVLVQAVQAFATVQLALSSLDAAGSNNFDARAYLGRQLSAIDQERSRLQRQMLRN